MEEAERAQQFTQRKNELKSEFKALMRTLKDPVKREQSFDALVMRMQAVADLYLPQP